MSYTHNRLEAEVHISHEIFDMPDGTYKLHYISTIFTSLSSDPTASVADTDFETCLKETKKELKRLGVQTRDVDLFLEFEDAELSEEGKEILGKYF